MPKSKTISPRKRKEMNKARMVARRANNDEESPMLAETFFGATVDDVSRDDTEIPIRLLDYTSRLLKMQFGQQHGCSLPSTLYGCTAAQRPVPGEYKIPCNVNAVQLHYIDNHYVVSEQRANIVAVYDSLYNTSRVARLRPQLNAIYEILSKSNAPLVRYAMPQSQGSTLLCGAFACATACLLLNNKQPSKHNFDTCQMREHLRKCVGSGVMSLFPEIPLTIAYKAKAASTAGLTTQLPTSTSTCRPHWMTQYMHDQKERKLEKASTKNEQKCVQYHSDNVKQAAKLAQAKARYANPEKGPQVLAQAKARYANPEKGPQVLAQAKARSKATYDNPDKRAVKLTQANARYANPDKGPQVLAQAKARYDDPDKGPRVLAQAKARYANPEKGPQVLAQAKARYANPLQGPVILERAHMQYQTDAENIKQVQKQKYQNETQKKRKIANVQQQAQKKKKMSANIDHAITNFKVACTEYPSCKCIICEMWKFPAQVVRFRYGKYPSKAQNMLTVQKDTIGQICTYCHNAIRRGKMPATAVSNKLDPVDLPEDINDLNTLEQHLISPVIPFMKIATLPRGAQKGIVGPIVCVPADINMTTHSLPRTQSDQSLVRVKLKRKQEYKGHHLYQEVRPEKIRAALINLKQHHPSFADISITSVSDATEQEVTISDSDEDMSDTNQTPVQENSSESDSEPEEESSSSALQATCLQPTDLAQYVADNYEDAIFNVSPGEGQKPISIFGKEAEIFPFLFPDGKNTYMSDREHKLSFSQYVKARLFSANTKFTSNVQYIFYLQYHKEFKEVLQSAAISLRKGRATTIEGSPVTVRTACNADTFRCVSQRNEGYKYLQAVRGSAPYWERSMRDLCAMVRQLGIPTWFASFSAADRRWPDMLRAIVNQQDKPMPEDLDWDTHCSYMASNPVTAARMFDKKVQNLLKHLLLAECKPIGQVVEHFVRVEFQQRGWPHIHCLFWVKDAPRLDVSSDSEVVAFIDQFVSTELPDNVEDKELHDIVGDVQMHSSRHSRSCKKGGKVCRFNFPRPPSCRTFISRPSECPKDTNPKEWQKAAKDLLSQVSSAIQIDPPHETTHALFESLNITQEMFEEAWATTVTKTTIVYKRRPADIWVNPYNRHLLRAWDANIDLQFVADAYSCIRYIVSYISKKESTEGQMLRAAQEAMRSNETSNSQVEVQQLGKIYLTHRELSIMEAVYRATGLKLKQCSREVVWVPTDPDSTKVTLPLRTLNQRDPDSNEVWATSLNDRYLARPHKAMMTDLSLAEFASSYKVVYKPKSEKDKSDSEAETDSEVKQNTCIMLNNDLGYVSKRKEGKEAIIRYAKYSSTASPERYFMNVLTLYLPHFDKNFKPPQYETYEAYYNQGSVTYKGQTVLVQTVIQQKRSIFEINAAEIDDALHEVQQNPNQEDAWAHIAPEAETDRIETTDLLDSDHEDYDMSDLPDLEQLAPKQPHSTAGTRSHIQLNVLTIPEGEAKKLMRSMNIKQRQIFSFIRQWCVNKVEGKNPDPVHVFLTGGAGTGKSHVIKALLYEASKILRVTTTSPEDKTVLLVAPTGTAAFNVGGQTVHSAFKLPVTGMSGKYIPLGEDLLTTLRSKYQHLQLLIIDEVSMVSKGMMNYISGRLDQIKRHRGTSWFGGISLLAVGDFFQVPPVGGKLLIRPDRTTVIDTWEYFAKWTLTDIMRQQGDKAFAEMLNYLRTRAASEPVRQDVDKMLKSRVTAHPPAGALHVYPLRAAAHKHNDDMLATLSTKKYHVAAVDIADKVGAPQRRKTPVPVQSNLEPELIIAEGSRVMMTSNLDTEDGLVNGVMGTILKIEDGSLPLGQPQLVYVRFDNTRVGKKARSEYQTPAELGNNVTIVKTHTEPIMHLGQKYTRHQLPLRLSWACTIHKVQGMTVPEIVVSLNKTFRPGMGYVALSRVTSMDGLHLKDYKSKDVYCDTKITQDLENMPVLDLSKQIPIWQMSHSHLTIGFHNVQGACNKFDDIAANCDACSADILGISETWFKTGNPKHLKSFNVEENSRMHGNGGGVALYIREELTYHRLRLEIPNLEHVAITVPEEDMTVCIIYRPPSVPHGTFETQLHDLVTQLPPSTLTVIGGDFNLNIASDAQTNAFKIPACYKQVVSQPTTNHASLLDHIYVKCPMENFTAGVSQTYYSDHDLTYVCFPK